ncbi:MAG: alpha/beta hydrolase family protein, partial [Opitutaceae bacterium]
AAAPSVDGPPPPRANAAGAAPGAIRTPARAEVDRGIERARRLAAAAAGNLIVTPPTTGTSPDFFSDETLRALLDRLAPGTPLLPVGTALADRRTDQSPAPRQARLVRAWEGFLQGQIATSRVTRDERFWKPTPVTTPEAWAEAMRPHREKFATETLGRVTPTNNPPHPRSRLLVEKPGWTAHEVVLDVAPDVFAWGYLLQPADLRPGERRPVVVAQHGLEGVPAELIDEDPSTRAFSTYKAFAVRLVERGFIVFAPHNPYRGPDFRQLQRKAHPLGLSLFSFITAQHERILDWLGGLPHVDRDRIGFYGLSYGGSTAMRVPAILTRYAAVVCSGNFNEWVWKLSTTSWSGSYTFTREYEMPEFDLAGTFNHAEMAALIAPRPFMVERGHADGVGIDEWVAFEYAKVRRLYDRLGIPERTQLEYFNGPHTIHGVETYAFLHRHLAWPEPNR